MIRAKSALRRFGAVSRRLRSPLTPAARDLPCPSRSEERYLASKPPESGECRFMVLAGFTTAIVIVVTLIVQLDYLFRGEVSISVEPFEHLLSELGPQPGPNSSTGAVP